MTGDRVAFGLGANLGDARTALRTCVAALREEPGLTVIAVSSLYRTAPVGGPVQPDFLNAVVVAESSMSADGLLDLAHTIENELQRTREVRWGPRTLDVDILAVGGCVRADRSLTLPHPRAHVRGFVLVPWAEIDPGFVLPGLGTVAELLRALPHAARREVVAVAGPGWADPAAGA